MTEHRSISYTKKAYISKKKWKGKTKEEKYTIYNSNKNKVSNNSKRRPERDLWRKRKRLY